MDETGRGRTRMTGNGQRSAGQKETGEKKTGGTNTWSVLKRTLAMAGRLNWYLVAAIVVAVVVSVIAVVQSDFLARLLDSMLAADLERLKWTALVTVAIAVADLLLSSTQQASLGYFAHCSLERLHAGAAHRISHAQASYMTQEHSGQILSRLTSDLGLVQSLLQQDLLGLVSGSLTGLLAISYMFYKNWLLALIAIFGTPAIFLAMGRLNRPLTAYSKEAQEALGQINVVVEETIAGASIARAFGLGETLSERFRAGNRLWLDKSARRITYSALLASVGLTVSFTPFLLVFGFGGLLMLKGKVTFGTLFAFINLLNYVSFPIQELPRVLGEIASKSAALERVLEILDLPVEREDGESCEFDVNAPVVEFRNVTFSYPGTRTPALRDVSFAVEQGEKVAFAGSSGSGKSTILRLLLGEYDPNQGSIFVGGHDIRKWSLKSLRSRFGKVSQDTYLFPYSVTENLTLGLAAPSPADICMAAQIACADSFVRELPDSYDTLLGEMGGRLSGGERQRLSLARAILRKPRVLLLDEATSAMDYDLERKVLTGLKDTLEGVTTLAIAHRLSTIAGADHIYVLENGSIVESGDHASLMDSQGRYASLHTSQTAGQRGGIL